MRRQLYCLLICLLLQAPTAIGKPTAEPDQAADGSTVDTPRRDIPTTPSKRPRLSRQQMAQLQQDIYRYQQTIGEIESREGAYGTGMSEQLDSLGVAFQKLGRHQRAIDAFKRAVHLTRIHEGLYTQTQLPMLKKQIISLMALKRWKEVNDRYQYIFWLNRQNFGKDDPRMLPALALMSRWHLQAYAMKFGRDRDDVTNHLIQAHVMLQQSLILLEQSGADEQQLVDKLNGLTLTNYLFATYERTPLETLYSQGAYDPKFAELSRSAQVIDTYINRSFRGGRDAIGRVIDIYRNSKTAPPSNLAKAKVKLADWLFLFNKSDAAFQLYAEAYNQLSETGEGARELKRIFDHPVALPNNELLNTSDYNSTDLAQYDPAQNYVLASFDVTAKGRAANIEIIESNPPDNISARAQAKRTLRQAKFRPRFVEGAPALTEKMQLRILSH